LPDWLALGDGFDCGSGSAFPVQAAVVRATVRAVASRALRRGKERDTAKP
jgi:hypothetical protein